MKNCTLIADALPSLSKSMKRRETLLKVPVQRDNSRNLKWLGHATFRDTGMNGRYGMRSVVFLALVILSPLTASAESREDRLAVATEYVELSMASFDLGALIETMYIPVIEAAEAQGKNVSSEEKAKLAILYKDTFTGPLTDVMRSQAPMMADLMTMAEITALRDFHSTPEGQSVMAKLPQIVAAQQPAIMALMQETMPSLLPQVIEIIGD
jgi:hypothetical protein